MEKKHRKFMVAKETKCNTVLEYAPVSNGRAERILGTLKAVVKIFVLSSGRPGMQD